jgi:hypothetical protein
MQITFAQFNFGSTQFPGDDKQELEMREAFPCGSYMETAIENKWTQKEIL